MPTRKEFAICRIFRDIAFQTEKGSVDKKYALIVGDIANDR